MADKIAEPNDRMTVLEITYLDNFLINKNYLFQLKKPAKKYNEEC